MTTKRLPPIATLRARITRGQLTHEAVVDGAWAAAALPAAAHVLTQAYEAPSRAAARWADACQAAGMRPAGLAGLPVTVKDLYDVAGQVTTAGAALRRDAAPALADAPAVARLRACGAALIGKTNMTEYAFSGVGINPHFGTPRNPADDAVARIPGGSSSGAAVSVALGMAVAALGSDTGGSIRIPAALCGLVGFKGTQSRVPLDGAFPLSHTLDTVCAMTRTVDDALRVDAVIADAPMAVERRPLAGRRLALPQTLVLDAMEPAVARAFERSLGVLSAAGATLIELPLAELAEVAERNSPGGFSAVEAWATHEADMKGRREAFDHRVAARIALGETVTAAQYLRLHRRRREWIASLEARLDGFDAWLCPTVPIVAPPIEALQASDERFFRDNGLLLRNTFLVNYADGCAFSLPCQREGELPVGLMLAASRGQDARLASVALAVEAALAAAGFGAPA